MVCIAWRNDPIEDESARTKDWVANEESTKEKGNGTVSATDNPCSSFYEVAYAKATQEQKEELDKIISDDSMGLPSEWKQSVLITTGELDKDTPRLKVTQAAELYDSKGIKDLESEFNKIAGAPDFVGGSGFERTIYYLNEERTEAVCLMLNDVFYIVFNNDGIQLKWQELWSMTVLPEKPSRKARCKSS